MRSVRTKNTTAELRVRQALHAAGFRFRLHKKELPGTPDIVLPRYKMCIFVNGCFWHGHEGCSKSALPNTRREFWAKKIEANQERDRIVREDLKKTGWKVEVVWECRTKSNDCLSMVIQEIVSKAQH